MAHAWNEQAFEFAVNNQGHHKYKIKTEKLLKSYAFEHVLQISRKSRSVHEISPQADVPSGGMLCGGRT